MCLSVVLCYVLCSVYVLFVNEWTDPTSPLNKAVKLTNLFSTDQNGEQPVLSFFTGDDPTEESFYTHRRLHRLRPFDIASIVIGIIAVIGLVVYNIRRIIR
jgi:hypothetical protein